MPPRTIALFDFDGTLVQGDSLWPFLLEVAGAARVGGAFGRAFGAVAVARPEDARTFVKARVLRELLAGKSVDAVRAQAAGLRSWPRWLPTLARLREHYEAGHHVVIASGGVDLCLPLLLETVPHHTLICTRMEVRDGVLTGEMESGNCVRRRKAELVAAYLAEHGPFADSWGYGNLPHDLPMLGLVNKRVVV